MSTDTDTKEIVRRPRTPLPEIAIAGDVLMRRELFARQILGVNNRTVTRMNLPTVYISGIAYVARAASLKVVADRLHRRNRTATHRAVVT